MGKCGCKTEIVCDECIKGYEGKGITEVKVKEFLSKQGTKFDDNKVRMELLSTVALTEIAKVLTFGAKKYEANNWRQGIRWSRVLGATIRHIFAYLHGEDKDPESGLSHLAHAGCCIMFLLEYELTHTELDDRFRASVSKNQKEN